jgi:hypothetical protein
MKKLLMVLMLAMAYGVAMAEESPLTLNLISAKDGSGDVGFKLPVSDIQKGIFVQIGGLFSRPKTILLIKETLKAKGLKVVDRIEDADYGLEPVTSIFDKIEDDADEYTKTTALASNLARDFAIIVLTGHMSAMKGVHELNFDKPLNADVTFRLFKNPKVGSFNWLNGTEEKNVVIHMELQVNRPPHKGDAFNARWFQAITAQYVNLHFDGLPAPTAPPISAPVSGGDPAASAVAPATPVAAN